MRIVGNICVFFEANGGRTRYINNAIKGVHEFFGPRCGSENGSSKRFWGAECRAQSMARFSGTLTQRETFSEYFVGVRPLSVCMPDIKIDVTRIYVVPSCGTKRRMTPSINFRQFAEMSVSYPSKTRERSTAWDAEFVYL